jgi:hypothetical protein
MAHCPDCGSPLYPDSKRCPKCFPVEFRRNAALEWTAWGAGIGVLVGPVVGIVIGITLGVLGDTEDALTHIILAPFLGALGGAVAGGIVVLVWKSLLRPVGIALFASPETFQREYGTPEERGIIEGGDPEVRE